MTHTFDDLWQTLTAHHLEGADPAVTITPQDYRASGPDSQRTRPPASRGPSRQVETLPFLALSSEPGSPTSRCAVSSEREAWVSFISHISTLWGETSRSRP